VIADAMAFIHSVVLPFFDRFKDIRSLILKLSERTPSKAFSCGNRLSWPCASEMKSGGNEYLIDS
jgi:hypothetical protein